MKQIAGHIKAMHNINFRVVASFKILLDIKQSETYPADIDKAYLTICGNALK